MRHVSWLARAAGTDDDLAGIFGLLPHAHSRFRELFESLWDPRNFDIATLELCRIRIAVLLGCAEEARVRIRDAAEAGLSEAKIEMLSRYATADDFPEVERACIAYVEQYVLDPHGLRDEDFARLRAHLSEPQIATLTLAAAVFDALARFRLALGVNAARDTATTTPACRARAEPTKDDATVVLSKGLVTLPANSAGEVSR